jgi:FAD/FMN-containing dehydrogenase
MGSQIASSSGVHVDMRQFNRLIWIDPLKKRARVQSGMRWRELQTALDPLNLSVKTMQSYSNFTVGGSVSVNCHGRYIGHGSIIHSIRSLQLILSNGETIEANREKHTPLFYAAFGGYGGVGIITEIELDLDDNFTIERQAERIPLFDYADWFKEKIATDPSVLLHNADLTPPAFNSPFAVTWRRTDKKPTINSRLRSPNQINHTFQAGIWAMSELPHGYRLRELAQKEQEKSIVVWRNYEVSLM